MKDLKKYSIIALKRVPNYMEILLVIMQVVLSLYQITILSQLTDFYPCMKFMGAEKENKQLGYLIRYCELLVSGDSYK